jgi:Spy/CpxP family protein refolding chaperone
MTSKGKAISTIVVSILIGAVGGIFIDQNLFHGRVPFGGSPSRYENFKNRLFKELDLSSEQQAQLEQLLQRRQEAFNEFRKSFDSQFTQLRETTRDSIRTILTSGQRDKFEGIVKEFDAQRKRDSRK